MIRMISSAAVAAVLVTTAPLDAADWTYEGPTGADRWGQIEKAFEKCEAGIMQSPIDLGNANATGNIEVSVDWAKGPLAVLNNGHTVQVNFASGSTMVSGGKTFNLLQVHFHTPSEHAVDGEHFPMTGHFVHASEEGELAVLGVMYVTGATHDEMQKLVDVAPARKADAMTVEGVMIDPNKLLPPSDGDIGVYRYMGSLTTPPCSEGVNWHVVPEPVEIGADQLAAMEGIMGMNARPVQLLNGRLLVAPE